MTRALRRKPLTLLSCLALVLAPSLGRGQVIAAGPGAFVGFAPITFDGLPDGLDVNGLIAGGVQFSYSLGGGIVLVNGGPGITNNVAPQNLVSLGNPTGILTLILPNFVNLFGYGFAVLSAAPVPNATTVRVFNGATNLGAVSFLGLPDPTFSGGFAGVQSVTAFNRVELTFAPAEPAWAIDNLRMGVSTATVIPEPATTLLVSAGLVVVFGLARRRAKTGQTA